MAMYKYKELLHLDLETSSLCNALCPVCNRRANGGLKNKTFRETYVTLEDFKNWFSDDFVSQLYGMQMCGNYGDAMTNPDLIPILTHVKSINPKIVLTMNTNASGRDPEFWYELAKLIGHNGYLTFSVDGLEDTNHIYRRGTYWDKIMMAMKNYIRGGGRARWEFLVFKHNQHQIEEAKALAKKIGIQEFYEKKALGFVHHDTEREIKEGIKVFDTDGLYQYMIESPAEEFTNKIVANQEVENPRYERVYNTTKQMDGVDVDAVIKEIKERKYKRDYTKQEVYIPPVFELDPKRPLTKWEKKMGSCKIDCMVSGPRKSFFVTSEGLVFPCCFTASKYYAYDNEEVAQLKNFIDSYGKKNISLEHNSLEDIINGPMFQERWIENFNDNDVRNKRLRTCAIFCGKETNEEFSETIESIEKKSNAFK